MSEEERIERAACEIAFHVYGGYPISRDEREKWPTWKRCMEAARSVSGILRNAP
jgi:hypothetical protein